MVSTSKVKATDQFELAAKLVGYSSSTRYKMRGDFLFEGIPFAGARVLDIGCGTGAWTIWAALNRADQVIGIEPEAHGSKSNTLTTLRRTIETLELDEKASARNIYFHQLPLQESRFNVVIMHNVINHLDEDAVVVLHRDPAAFKRYVSILQYLYSRVHVGGWVVVADCMRDNFWSTLGLRSPLAPTIEWHKHQHPQTWIDVFKHAGFQTFDLRWSPLYPLPRLTANWLVQYFTSSHFVLRFRTV